MDIGKKIKELRILKGLTQEELADRAELTKGFISQVERNHTSPSIATLVDILQCLGTDLKNFFEDDEDNQIVFSKEDYFEKEDKELKNMIQCCAKCTKKSVGTYYGHIRGRRSTYPDNHHEGEEFGYVLSGTIKVVLGSKTYKVKKGETFYYEAKYKHYLKSDKGAKVLGLVAPQVFKTV